MSCNCNDNTIFITKIRETANKILLIPNREVKLANLGNLCNYKLIIGCGLKAENNVPVFISTDDGEIPLLSKYANDVYASQLKIRYCYYIGYGNDNLLYDFGQFVIFQNLCLSCHGATTRSKAIDKEIKK